METPRHSSLRRSRNPSPRKLERNRDQKRTPSREPSPNSPQSPLYPPINTENGSAPARGAASLGTTTGNRSTERRQTLIDLALVFVVLLVSMGFPGQYTRLLGSASSTLLEYTAFGLQLVLMLFSSGKGGVMELRLLDIKPK